MAADRQDRSWYALAVRSRHEFVVSDELRKRGVETYLPSTEQVRQWSDRKKRVVLPLFPGYLFVSLRRSAEEFLRAVQTRGAVALLCAVPGYPAPVPDSEIDSLRLLLASGSAFDLYPSLQNGARVRVRRGPLAGAEGVLERRDDHELFSVTIGLLGRSVCVKLPVDLLEAA